MMTLVSSICYLLTITFLSICIRWNSKKIIALQKDKEKLQKDINSLHGNQNMLFSEIKKLHQDLKKYDNEVKRQIRIGQRNEAPRAQEK